MKVSCHQHKPSFKELENGKGAARVDTSTVQRGHDPTDSEDDFGILVEGFEYYMYFIYFLSLVFICRENPRQSGILLFPDCPRFC